MNAEEFLVSKGLSKSTIKAVRFPHRFENTELELLPLMEEYARFKRSEDIVSAISSLPIVDLSKVNRVEVIDEKGRSYVNWEEKNRTSLSLQDNGRTLKVFISEQ
jgi:hypothetical protein